MIITRQYSHESEESNEDNSPHLDGDEEILPLRPITQAKVSGKLKRKRGKADVVFFHFFPLL